MPGGRRLRLRVAAAQAAQAPLLRGVALVPRRQREVALPAVEVHAVLVVLEERDLLRPVRRVLAQWGGLVVLARRSFSRWRVLGRTPLRLRLSGAHRRPLGLRPSRAPPRRSGNVGVHLRRCRGVRHRGLGPRPVLRELGVRSSGRRGRALVARCHGRAWPLLPGLRPLSRDRAPWLGAIMGISRLRTKIPGQLAPATTARPLAHAEAPTRKLQ